MAELKRPDMFQEVVPLTQVPGEPGAFEAVRVAGQSGITRVRFLASGRTSREQRFTREATRTAAVWHGGSNPHPGQDGGGRPGGGPGGGGGPGAGDGLDWCEFLRCLTGREVISDDLAKCLARLGLDIRHLRKCLDHACRDRPGRPSVELPDPILRAQLARLLTERPPG